MRRMVLIGLLCAGCLPGTGCGADQNRSSTQTPREERAPLRKSAPTNTKAVARPRSTHLVITLAGKEGPMDTGVAMAYGRGYFKEHRLAVAILSPLTPTRPIRYVVEGTDELGVAAQPQVALAREKGVPIVAVGSLVPRPTATMMWLRSSKIHAVADLRGKTIGIPGLQFQRALLDVVLRKAGVAPAEVKIAKVGYGLTARLASGDVDAIFGGSRSVEGVELESRGLEPVITPVSRLGVPPYEEMVWIARRDFAEEHPEVIRGFLAAVRQGNAAARASPAVAARAVEKSAERNQQLTPIGMKAGARTAAPLLSRTARMIRPRARHLLRWMRAAGLIRGRLPASALQTNRYIAGT